MPHPTEAEYELRWQGAMEPVRLSRKWFLALGVVLMLLGVAALLLPVAATLATEMLVGLLLLIAGVFETLHGIGVRRWSGSALSIALGALALVAGVLLLAFPMEGALTLTLVLAVFFIVEGVLKLALALRLRPLSGWGWMLTSAVVALVLAAVILLGLPGTALWVLGVLLGIDLIVAGATLTALAAAAGKAA